MRKLTVPLLQARYLFALDFHDPDLYVTTFTEDGVLDYGSGAVKGRQAIKDVIARMPNPAPAAGLRAAAARHNISNIVIKVNVKWLFTKRTIFNEGRDEWAYKGGKNPAW